MPSSLLDVIFLFSGRSCGVSRSTPSSSSDKIASHLELLKACGGIWSTPVVSMTSQWDWKGWCATFRIINLLGLVLLLPLLTIKRLQLYFSTSSVQYQFDCLYYPFSLFTDFTSVVSCDMGDLSILILFYLDVLGLFCKYCGVFRYSPACGNNFSALLYQI